MGICGLLYLQYCLKKAMLKNTLPMSAVLLKWWQKYSVLQILHGPTIIQLVHINLSVLSTLLGCIFGSEQGKHCVTVCSCPVMLYAPLPFFTALIQLSNWWRVCCSFWLVVHFHSTPHEAEFKLIKDILYLVHSYTAPKSALLAWLSLSTKALSWTKIWCQLSFVCCSTTNYFSLIFGITQCFQAVGNIWPLSDSPTGCLLSIYLALLDYKYNEKLCKTMCVSLICHGN